MGGFFFAGGGMGNNFNKKDCHHQDHKHHDHKHHRHHHHHHVKEVKKHTGEKEKKNETKLIKNDKKLRHSVLLQKANLYV